MINLFRTIQHESFKIKRYAIDTIHKNTNINSNFQKYKISSIVQLIFDTCAYNILLKIMKIFKN